MQRNAPETGALASFSLSYGAPTSAVFGENVGISDRNRTSICRETQLELEIDLTCGRHKPFRFLDDIEASASIPHNTPPVNQLKTHHTINMKTATYFAIITAAVPAVFSLPANVVSRQFNYTVPSCGAATCLPSSNPSLNGTFVATGASNGTAPSDLGAICSLPQDDVTRYVQTVQPCIDGTPGKVCTAGAIYRRFPQYKICFYSSLTTSRVQGPPEG